MSPDEDGRDRDLLDAVASLPVPDPGEEWLSTLPSRVLAEASRRESALLGRVAELPVPDPDAEWSAALPARVLEEIGARRRPRFPVPPAALWWGGGIAAAAAALLLFLRFPASPLSQAADDEFLLAVNSSSITLGEAADLAGAGGAGPDWMEGLEGEDLIQGEDGDLYRSPVPRDWELPEERTPPGGDDGLTSGARSLKGAA